MKGIKRLNQTAERERMKQRDKEKSHRKLKLKRAFWRLVCKQLWNIRVYHVEGKKTEEWRK